MTWVRCVVDDAGGVALIEEVDKVVEVGWRCDCRLGVVIEASLSAVLSLSMWCPHHRDMTSR